MAPPEATHAHGRVTTDDGMDLRFQSWIPERPKAVLYFVHGLAEHSGRYGFPVEYFTRRGYACWAFDLRGHGESSGRRVHVNDFDDYAVDVAAVQQHLRREHGDLPVFLVGHSMGGLIALRYFLDHQDVFCGAILSSPALRTHPSQEPPKVLRAIAGLLSRLMPGMLFPSDLETEAISRDPAIVDAYRADPLVSSKVSARWFTSIEKAMGEVRTRCGEVHQPLLIMHSGGDRLTDPKASQRWAEEAPDQWVTHVEWPDLYHEMFNEPQRDEVFQGMEGWLEKRLAGD